MLLTRLLNPAVTTGALSLVDADGRVHQIGRGTPTVAVRLHDKALHRELALNPRLRFGEAYMDGRLTVEGGSIFDVLTVLCQDQENIQGLLGRLSEALGPVLRMARQHNSLGRARRNVAHHYDLSRRFYELFLDRDLQYSCAYFRTPDLSSTLLNHAGKQAA